MSTHQFVNAEPQISARALKQNTFSNNTSSIHKILYFRKGDDRHSVMGSAALRCSIQVATLHTISKVQGHSLIGPRYLQLIVTARMANETNPSPTFSPYTPSNSRPAIPFFFFFLNKWHNSTQ